MSAPLVVPYLQMVSTLERLTCSIKASQARCRRGIHSLIAPKTRPTIVWHRIGR